MVDRAAMRSSKVEITARISRYSSSVSEAKGEHCFRGSCDHVTDAGIPIPEIN